MSIRAGVRSGGTPKKLRSSVAGIVALAFATLSACAWAIPFASMIRVSTTSPAPQTGLTISYIMNETADSVTIELIDSLTQISVASFPGPAAQGSQSVYWNGRSANLSGIAVAAGNYRVRVRAVKNAANTWKQFASKRSIAQYGVCADSSRLFKNFSGMDLAIQKNTDSNDFGYIDAITCYTGQFKPQAGAVAFTADLGLVDGWDGYSVLRLKHPSNSNPTQNTDVWGCDFDPDNSDIIWVTGQNASQALSRAGGELATALTNADPQNALGPDQPRSVAIRREGSRKFAYYVAGDSQIYKIEIDTNTNNTMGSKVALLALSNSTRYSKDIEFDATGNMYWAVRRTGSGTSGGGLYRWDASQVLGMPPAAPLTEANASWKIGVPASATNVKGVAITPQGSVFIGADDGVYLVGNTSSAANVKTLTATDKQFYQGFSGDDLGMNLKSDAFGNLYLTDRSNETIRGWSPGGNTNTAVIAPPSQTFNVSVPVPVGVTGFQVD